MTCSRLAHWLSLSCGALLLIGCDLLDSTEWVPTIGYIDPDIGADPGSLEVPSIVRRGVPFEVKIVTYGSGDCTRPGEAEVKYIGRTAEITPHDLTAVGGGGACTADLMAFPRMETLQFDEAGDGLVRLSGLSVHPEINMVMYEAELVIEP